MPLPSPSPCVVPSLVCALHPLFPLFPSSLPSLLPLLHSLVSLLDHGLAGLQGVVVAATRGRGIDVPLSTGQVDPSSMGRFGPLSNVVVVWMKAATRVVASKV